MSNNKTKILVLVEGAKTDVRLMNHLIKIYEIDLKYTIVSYNTNIYTLYNEMFKDKDPDSMDLLQVLKERESDNDKKAIFDEKYSDILLIFDLDPHDPQFSNLKITEMLNYFVESSDMGKLYLNYPMVESFYHMTDIPDSEFINRCVSMAELKNGLYKQRVNMENRNKNYSKFAVTKSECNIVISENIKKAWHILDKFNEDYILPAGTDILTSQLNKIDIEGILFVLCTCIFFIVDYNPRLIKES